MADTILLAGAGGDLGTRIARELVRLGADVRALVRRGTASQKVARIRNLHATVVECDVDDARELRAACAGATCVVSALNGLGETIVDAQTLLLEAAIAAGVPRFIPSDYSLDYTKIRPGSNRNMDLRMAFRERIDRAPIAATSILNGMFADLLVGEAPVILFKQRRVLFWGSADQLMDFTTIDDAAAFTAAAALDPATPRFLRIAGDRLSARGLAAAASDATGTAFRPLRAGGLGVLRAAIALVRTVAPAKGEVFPPWQGMQYLENMLGGTAKLEPLDNARYPTLRWTSVREVLASRR